MKAKSSNALPRAQKRFFLCITRALDAKWTRSWLSRASMASLWSKTMRMVFTGNIAGRYLGTLGQLATLSFHETKNFTCGEGGALLINDANFNQRAEILREKGTDRSRFFRGEIDKYTWVDVGSSYLPAD